MYDAIIVGARCAGSPLAMLLARQGYRVLLLDRATFPSDTISTHFIWPTGLSMLKRWGLLDRLLATGCPIEKEIRIDLGAFQLTGAPPATAEGINFMVGPRRTVLDKLLRDAAEEAGAEVIEGFTVTGVTTTDGCVTGIRGHRRQGEEVEHRARLVIGADGRNSQIAAAVAAEQYNTKPVMTCCYYGYWRNVPRHTSTLRPRPGRLMVTAGTHDGNTIAIVMFPKSEFENVKSDVERHFMETIDSEPELSALLRAGERVERFYGTGDIPNFFRKPYGPGWALVGDAGYHKDPCTAQGISDAFRSAQWLADAIHAGFSGARPLDDAMADYQRTRDEHLASIYDFTCGLATLEPPPPEIQALYGALINNRADTDRFVGIFAGTVGVPEFFAPENISRIMGQASAAAN